MKRLFVVFTLAAAVCGLSAAAHAQISIDMSGNGANQSPGYVDWSTNCTPPSPTGLCFYFPTGGGGNQWQLSVPGGDSANGTSLYLGTGAWAFSPTSNTGGTLSYIAGSNGDTFTAGNAASGVLSGTMATGTLSLKNGIWTMSFNMTNLSLDTSSCGGNCSPALQALYNAGGGTISLTFSADSIRVNCAERNCGNNFFNTGSDNYGATGGSVTPTPEPVSLGLFATGLLPGAWWLRRRRWGKAN